MISPHESQFASPLFDGITEKPSEFLRAIVEATPECVKIVSPEGRLALHEPGRPLMIEGEKRSSRERTFWI